jgi:hypothetical protein
MDQFIAGMQLVWYVLTAGSLIFLVYDLATNTPAMSVMKAAWVLIVLYTGPIGLFVFLLSCRQPLPGTHEQFIQPHWKQAVGSLMHCVAGDATGIILAAALVSGFGLPNGVDLLIEYCAAFVVGLLVFQALFMLPMLGGHYLTAVRKTFFAEFVSMNMVMVGMVPVMVLLMHYLPASREPTRPLFWSVMSLATLAGAVTAYPINSWLVRRGLKHGMMSAKMPAMPDHAAMGHDMSGMGHEKGGMDHGKSATALPPGQAVAVMVLTLVLLGAAVAVTSRYAPIMFFRHGMPAGH